MYIDFEHVCLIQSEQSSQWFPSNRSPTPTFRKCAQKRDTSLYAAAGQFAMISANQIVQRVFRVAAIAH
jgi:hypothetical protein